MVYAAICSVYEGERMKGYELFIIAVPIGAIVFFFWIFKKRDQKRRRSMDGYFVAGADSASWADEGSDSSESDAGGESGGGGDSSGGGAD